MANLGNGKLQLASQSLEDNNTQRDATIQLVSINDVCSQCDLIVVTPKSKLTSIDTFLGGCAKTVQLNDEQLVFFIFIKGGQMLSGVPCFPFNARGGNNVIHLSDAGCRWDQTESDRWHTCRATEGALFRLFGCFLL